MNIHYFGAVLAHRPIQIYDKGKMDEICGCYMQYVFFGDESPRCSYFTPL